MTDLQHYHDLITHRLTELGVRLHEIEEELSHPIPADLEDQAIDLEDDEVLERLGRANETELRFLHDALKRIEDGSYGICARCGEDISDARLAAVPHTMVCKACAAEG